MNVPTMFKNGEEIDGGSSYRLMQTFADPNTELDMFYAGMDEFNESGEFEFVLNNDVYLIKMVMM